MRLFSLLISTSSSTLFQFSISKDNIFNYGTLWNHFILQWWNKHSHSQTHEDLLLALTVTTTKWCKSLAFIHRFMVVTTSLTALSKKRAPLKHFLIGMDCATPSLTNVNVISFWWHIAHYPSHLQAIIFAPTNVKISLIPTLVYLQQMNVITQSKTIRKVRYCMFPLALNLPLP